MPPAHILNAPTRLMKELGYGRGYAYDHDAPERFSGQNYFPDGMERQTFYRPTEEGAEAALRREARALGAAAAQRAGGCMSEVELRTVGADEARAPPRPLVPPPFPRARPRPAAEAAAHRPGPGRRPARAGQCAAARRPDASASRRCRPTSRRARPRARPGRGRSERCRLAALAHPARGRRAARARTSRPASRCRAAPGRGGISTACSRRWAAGGERPRLVHRLDRDTSGLLVVAKTRGRRGEADRGVPPAAGREAVLGAGGRASARRRRAGSTSRSPSSRARAASASRRARPGAPARTALSRGRPRRQGRELARAEAADRPHPSAARALRAARHADHRRSQVRRRARPSGRARPRA